MTEPRLNVKRLFNVPARPWPVVNRGGAINRVQKILKMNHVTGIPSHWPKLYYGQTRENLNLNRTYRNTNVGTLPDGAYLYLIEYNPETNRYHKSFVRVHNLLESGSRHFQLPVRNQGRIIIAAGELSKLGSKIVFNLESGTYTRNLMTMTRNYMTEANYIRLVKNALRTNMNYVKNILVPKVPASIGNLVAHGNISFYFGEPSAKSRAKVMANLKKAGLTTNSARNLILKLIEEGAQKTSPQTAKQIPKKPEPSANVGRRSARRPRG
jgi:hypothetical protein